MDADYSVELGPTAPALEIPWTDPEGRLQYVDLRAAPDAIVHIAEARQFPALARFLAEMNSPQSDWQTAKCDVWTEEVEPAENFYGWGFAQSCYVDLVLATGAMRDNLEAHEWMAGSVARALEEHDELEASAEIVVRRCYFHRDGVEAESDAGYCLTLFVTGYGSSAQEAGECWDRAMKTAGEFWLETRPKEVRAKGQELR